MLQLNFFHTTSTVLRNLKILIADDNHVFRKTLCDFLESLGRVTVVAEAVDGNHAIELSRKIHPDIILMDISMPNKTGLEAAKIIKQHHPEIFIAVITLHDGAIYRDLAKDCLADDFIPKSEMKSKLSALILQKLQTFSYNA